jgi:peptide/nickel transport system substrate-binding protein
MLIPKHLFDQFRGAKSRDAPTNLKPIGTGPYRFADFKPGDMVRGQLNPSYHESNRPYFDTIEMKGGGDAISAARAVIQTGEFDYAWNVQVEDEILLRLEQGGKGKAAIVAGGNIEHLQLNTTDPSVDVDGERSSLKTKAPVLQRPCGARSDEPARRPQVDRGPHIRTDGVRDSELPEQPRAFPFEEHEVRVQRREGERGLDAAGWKRGSDGHPHQGRQEAQVHFPDVDQPAAAEDPADHQAGVPESGNRPGAEGGMASVYFSSDVANPDTYTKFYCDMQMYTTTMTQPDPQVFMEQFTTAEVATKANKWQGRNISRWRSDEYDKVFHAAQNDLDPVRRASLFVKMNDLVITGRHIIPVVGRPRTSTQSSKLKSVLSGWDNDLWLLKDWYREA